MAHPAAENANPDVAGFGVDDVALDELELTLTGHLIGAVCRHEDP